MMDNLVRFNSNKAWLDLSGNDEDDMRPEFPNSTGYLPVKWISEVRRKSRLKFRSLDDDRVPSQLIVIHRVGLAPRAQRVLDPD